MSRITTLGEQRSALGAVSTADKVALPTLLGRRAPAVQTTISKLQELGFGEERLDGVDWSSKGTDRIVRRLQGELCKQTSFEHVDFSNPHAESCWLSPLFQSLYHSRVFHSMFDQLVRPLPAGARGKATNALCETWTNYEHAAMNGGQVSVHELVQFWGVGFGDCAEALGQLHAELRADAVLHPVGDQISRVVTSYNGETMPSDALWTLVKEVGATHSPLIAFEMALPPLQSASVLKFVLDIMPPKLKAAHEAELGDAHRLVAMICYMETFRHYVVFCRRQTHGPEWLFFNDMPKLDGMANSAFRELPDWTAVAHQCARCEMRPTLLLYENVVAAQAAVKEATPTFWRSVARRHVSPSQRSGLWSYLLGGAGCLWLVVVIASIAQQQLLDIPQPVDETIVQLML